jgi:hypothetical protein
MNMLAQTVACFVVSRHWGACRGRQARAQPTMLRSILIFTTSAAFWSLPTVFPCVFE